MFSVYYNGDIMKIYEVIFQDEYNNLFQLGYYKDLDDAIDDLNNYLNLYNLELKKGDLKEYSGAFNSCFDLDLTELFPDTNDDIYNIAIRGFVTSKEYILEQLERTE